MRVCIAIAAVLLAACTAERAAEPSPSPVATSVPADGAQPELERFEVSSGSRPHDVAPAGDGGVWYTGQGNGTLGLLDPSDGSVTEIALGPGARPHGVIVGRGGHAWVTDSGLNAIMRVDADTHDVQTFPLPGGNANLNTATFDGDDVLWFTGQAGVYGRLVDGEIEVFDAPGGRGPYGIATTPGGDVYYASLAGNHIARIDTATGEATRIDPPTSGQGARRVWSDSGGRLWVAEWNAGQLGRYDPGADEWREWEMPGDSQPYAVFVNGRDIVWVSDFGTNAIVRFDPSTETFTTVALPSQPSDVRQLLGRPGEVWGAESAADALVVVRT